MTKVFKEKNYNDILKAVLDDLKKQLGYKFTVKSVAPAKNVRSLEGEKAVYLLQLNMPVDRDESMDGEIHEIVHERSDGIFDVIRTTDKVLKIAVLPEQSKEKVPVKNNGKRLSAKALGKTTNWHLSTVNDDVLLRCAKQAGFDDISKYNDIWDAKRLSDEQRKKIISGLNSAGWDSVRGDGTGNWVELVSSKAIDAAIRKKYAKTSDKEKQSNQKDNSPALKDIKSAIAKLKKVKAVQTYITLAKRTARLYEAMNNSKKPKDNMPAIKANKAKMAKLAKMKSVSTLIKLVKKQAKLLSVV